MEAKLIPADKMSDGDLANFNALRGMIERNWMIYSYLPFTSDGLINSVFVAQKRNSNDARYYVFRAYSGIAGGGIEHESRHADADKAIEASRRRRRTRRRNLRQSQITSVFIVSRINHASAQARLYLGRRNER